MGASSDSNDGKLEDLPLPATIEKTTIILEQMQNNICKIITKNGKGTGFFCTIPHKNKKINVLITSNHLINEKMIQKKSDINLLLNDDKKEKNIELNEDRQIYTNKEYNITIIEIKKSKDKINDFLELDENIFRVSPNIFNETAYIIQYPKILTQQKAAVSYGIVKEIDDYEIIHFCYTESGSSGAPILNLSNNKVIGIHRESSTKLNCNKGTFLKKPINEFLNRVNLLNDADYNDADVDADDEDNNEKEKENENKKGSNKNVKKNESNKNEKKKEAKENKKDNKNSNKNDKTDDKNKKNSTNKEKNEANIVKNNISKKNKGEGGGNIKLKIKIEKGDINKEVYFLDNTDIFDENLVKHFHDFLGEFNDKNVDLFINEEKHKYQKFFKFEKAGTYNIRLDLKEKIEDCSYMFCNCNNLINIDLSSFQTDNVKDMTRMFYNCNNLTEIDLSSFETDNVTSMYSMFDQCYNLTDINVSSFNTSNVEDLSRMFSGCKKIKTLDLSKFDTSSVINASCMLDDCQNLKVVKINSDLFDKIEDEVNTKKIEFIVC